MFNAIKAAREEAGLSQTALAKESGVNRGTYRKWEKGEVSGTIVSFIKLCESLQVEPHSVVRDMTLEPEI